LRFHRGASIASAAERKRSVMKILTRRNLLSMAAMTPVAARFSGGAAAAPTSPPTPRQRLQQQHLPNIPLVTHEGTEVRFYDDLVKDKIVTFNFFYTDCGTKDDDDGICPTVTANLVEVQKLLGDEVGRQLFMYSFTLKPEEDDVNAIRQYRETFGAGPGWTFLTGKPDDIEKLRKAIGFTSPEPAIDNDKTQHIGNVRYGNEPLMLWAACPGMAHASYIAESISWMVRPETNRVQKP
jgi:protein SCO1